MFEYDVFISFPRENVAVAKQVHDLFELHGLHARYHPDGLKVGTKDLHEALAQDLANSQDLVVIESAAADGSEEMKWEFETFSKFADGVRRRTFRLRIADSNNNRLSTSEVYAPTVEKLVQDVVAATLERLRLSGAQLREAFNHYTHDRFWRPFVAETEKEKPSVHIFTCARDSDRKDVHRRGQGGRTNIDKWDYKTVLDITHFLRGRYPSTDVTIEEPLSKLRREDFRGPAAGGKHIANLEARVRNRNCIIVGSPDVSDFAEILWAQAHDIEPYDPERSTKSVGFTLQKSMPDDAVLMSSFYRRGEEGVLNIGSKKLYRAELDEEKRTGVMYGVLAVLRNPYCDRKPSRRVIILSGLSGVATNGIARFLTRDLYVNQFYEFDRNYANMSRDVEAVIGTRFTYDPRTLNERDTRQLVGDEKEIWYEELVELPVRPEQS